MDFEWDEAKASANLQNHKVDFENATRVFLDPFHLDEDDSDADEVRFNIIGIVDGQMLVVSRHAEQSAVKKDGITRFKLDPNNPPKSDWRALDAMSEEESHAAAVSDPDAQPLTEEQLKRMRRVPNVAQIRAKLDLTQEQFAARFGLSLGTVRDWEQGAHRPDRAAKVLLRVIERDPDAVVRALAPETAA